MYIFSFHQCTSSLFYFDPRLSTVNNLQKIHIFRYFLYIGLVTSNLCSCNRVQHTLSILYSCRNRPLCHPCKTTPNHVMTMVQFDISSRSHKNPCLFEEDPCVLIVSWNVCTLSAPWMEFSYDLLTSSGYTCCRPFGCLTFL